MRIEGGISRRGAVETPRRDAAMLRLYSDNDTDTFFDLLI